MKRNYLRCRRDQAARLARCTRPTLEMLERRIVLAATAFAVLDASDGLLDGVYNVAGDLILNDGDSIVNNDPAAPTGNSAGAIKINVTGDLIINADSGGALDTGIFAENRVGGGSGGQIDVVVGGKLVMENRAVISSSRLVTSGGGHGGDINVAVNGDVDLQDGSIIAANTAGGNGGSKAGDILVTSSVGRIDADGLIASGPSTTVLGTKLTGLVLAGGNTTQKGGKITLKILTDVGNSDSTLSRLNVSTTGIIVSQGQDPSSDTILLESQCSGIRVYGLVASVAAKQHGSTTNVPQVIMRSPRFIEVHGEDLGQAGANQGRVRADYVVGERSIPANPNKVDLLARSYVEVRGPTAGTIYAVSAFGGTANNSALFGGDINVTSLGIPTAGGVLASGLAFDASAPGGGRGGNINLKARNDVNLDDATLRAIAHPSFTGGKITARSYDGNISWQDGVGDVRATGAGIAAAKRGVVALTAAGSITTTGTTYPVTSGAQTNPVTATLPFDAVAQAELETLDALLGLSICRVVTGHAPPINSFFNVDVDTTVNFNNAQFDGGGNLILSSVYTGDADLFPFFQPVYSPALQPFEWIARFIFPATTRLNLLDDTLLTVTAVGAGNNKQAPSIELIGGEIFVEGDLNGTGGPGAVIVTSVNQQAGHIKFDMAHSILVDGDVIDQVIGTNGKPGDIIFKTFCGNIHTGPESRVLTIGVDHGGSDIIMVNGTPGSILGGDIVIEGLVRATYKGGTPSTINLVNFKLPGKIVIDGTNDFGLISEAGGTIRLMSGVHIRCLRDPIPGTINLQAMDDIIVLGNDGTLAKTFGTVSIKTLSSNPKGGTMNAYSLNGDIIAQNRAFDNAGRNNGAATVTLKAFSNVLLTAPAGPLAVVDNSGVGSAPTSGGTNRIRAYNGTVSLDANAKVLATGAVPGRNFILNGAVPVVGALAGVNPNPVAPPVGDEILDPLVPLFPDLASLGL